MGKKEPDKKKEKLAAMKRAVEELQKEVLILRNRTGALERRLDRVELREELLESPAASGDASAGTLD